MAGPQPPWSSWPWPGTWFVHARKPLQVAAATGYTCSPSLLGGRRHRNLASLASFLVVFWQPLGPERCQLSGVHSLWPAHQTLRRWAHVLALHCCSCILPRICVAPYSAKVPQFRPITFGCSPSTLTVRGSMASRRSRLHLHSPGSSRLA